MRSASSRARQLHRHPVERARHVRDLVAAGLGRAGRQVAGAESFGRRLQRLQAAARRREDEGGGDNRRDDQQRGSRDREQPADFARDRTVRRPRRQDHHAAQRAVHLDRRHHDRRPLDSFGSCPRGHCCRPSSASAERRRSSRAAAAGSPRPGRRFITRYSRLHAAYSRLTYCLQIEPRILRERRADVGGDDRGHVVRRPQRERRRPGP